MSEIVLRAAQALVAELENQQLGSVSAWHDPEFRDNAMRAARAAIAALREPTEAMIDAGGGKLLGNSPMAETVWHAMCDAALSEQPPPQRRDAAGGR